MGHSRITEDDVYFDGGISRMSYVVTYEDDWMEDLKKDDPYGVWETKQNQKGYSEKEFDNWFSKMKKEEKWFEKLGQGK